MENRVTEPKRLACLRGLEILDTASEEAFDRLTQLAADAVGVPVAFTSLVDEARVWLKSKVGTTLCEAPRSESFCPHTIALGDVLVVEDATLDSRFAALHLVVAEGVRFYAGAPVALANGAVVGAVCVIDVVPRPTPSPPAIALLKGLAAAAGHLLDLRRELLARREAERRLAEHARLLELAEEMAGIGTFRFDVATGALDVSPSILGIFGLGPTACAPPVDALLAMFEPSERAKIVGGLKKACTDRAAYGFDAKLRRVTDGSMRDVRLKGRVEAHPTGRPETLVGVFSDVTVEKAAFEALDLQRAEASSRADRMTRLADTDALTGLPNRRAFLEKAERRLRGKETVTLAVLDLDHFKSINDRFGHYAGDVALATFGRLCAGLTDASCFAGRIGGEEFALLVVGKERLYMVDLVERLRWFVSQNPTRLEAGPTLSLTFSGGIAQALTGDNWTSLFARADEVLYRAKEEGRDRSLVAA